MEVKIRDARKEDIPGLVKLWQEMIDLHNDFPCSSVIDDFWKMEKDASRRWRDWIARTMRSSKHILIVATVKGKMIGYLKASIERIPSLFRNKRKIYISDLAVTEEYRSRGIGKALLENIGRRAAKSGIRFLTLAALPRNKGAMKFYRNNKFHEDKILFVKRV